MLLVALFVAVALATLVGVELLVYLPLVIAEGLQLAARWGALIALALLVAWCFGGSGD